VGSSDGEWERSGYSRTFEPSNTVISDDEESQLTPFNIPHPKSLLPEDLLLVLEENSRHSLHSRLLVTDSISIIIVSWVLFTHQHCHLGFPLSLPFFSTEKINFRLMVKRKARGECKQQMHVVCSAGGISACKEMDAVYPSCVETFVYRLLSLLYSILCRTYSSPFQYKQLSTSLKTP